jgi:hypothetical protein
MIETRTGSTSVEHLCGGFDGQGEHTGWSHDWPSRSSRLITSPIGQTNMPIILGHDANHINARFNPWRALIAAGTMNHGALPALVNRPSTSSP